jgi:hypothetical protein
VSYKYPGASDRVSWGSISSNQVKTIEKVLTIEYLGNVNKANHERSQGKHTKFKVNLRFLELNNSLQLFTTFLNYDSNFFKVNDTSVYKYLFVFKFRLIVRQGWRSERRGSGGGGKREGGGCRRATGS